MGLMQQACRTYEMAEKQYAGVYRADMKQPLAPISHSVTSASVEITLSKDGKFILAKAVSKEDAKTIIPVTEQSSGRTVAPAAHPLCEQVGYLSSANEEKFKLYVDQLQDWINSKYGHPMLQPILNYVKQGTILSDLAASGLATDEKLLVRWRVEGLGEEPCSWKNRELHEAFANYYRDSISSRERKMCMISGETDCVALQHVKGVSPINGNAKLISSNDSTGFTYRGRFVKEGEAYGIGYLSSQKAHNALRWLIANQGEHIGTRCFLCWSPEGKELPRVTKRFKAFRNIESTAAYIPSDYKKALWNKIFGWKSSFEPDDKAVTVVLDAATTGRLSILYYNEMRAEDFLERIAFWDGTCCWPNGKFGIQSPAIERIARYAFGTFRGKDFEVDDVLKKNTVMRLLPCRLERVKIPKDIPQQLTKKASKLSLYGDSVRKELLHIACASIKKYRYDYLGEEWNMILEEDNKDRSYQFGRLLAIMEKIERDTYSEKDSRETNAIRRQAKFVTRPYSTWVSVMEHLKRAYYPKLSPAGRTKYEKMIEQIAEIISEYGENLDRPLEDTYLLGYYLQKNAFYLKNNNNNNNNEEENVEE